MKKTAILLIIVMLLTLTASCKRQVVEDETATILSGTENVEQVTSDSPSDISENKSPETTDEKTVTETPIEEQTPEIKERPASDNTVKTEKTDEQTKTDTTVTVEPDTDVIEEDYDVITSDDVIINHVSYTTVSTKRLIETSHLVAQCEYIEDIQKLRIKSSEGFSQNFTDVKMKVNKVFRGKTEETEITVRLSGGNVGGVNEDYYESPNFIKGKKYILFLNIPDIYSHPLITDENYYHLVSTKYGAYVCEDVDAETVEYYNCSRTSKNPSPYTVFDGTEEHLLKNADDVVLSMSTFETVMTTLNKLIPITDCFKNEALSRIENNYKEGLITKEAYEAAMSSDKQYSTVIAKENYK